MPESDVMRNNQLSSKGLGSPLHSAKDDSEAQLRPMSFSEETLSGISSATDVVVLCWDAPAESDRRAQKIATFMGATVRFFSLTPSVLEESTSEQNPGPQMLLSDCPSGNASKDCRTHVRRSQRTARLLGIGRARFGLRVPTERGP